LLEECDYGCFKLEGYCEANQEVDGSQFGGKSGLSFSKKVNRCEDSLACRDIIQASLVIYESFCSTRSVVDHWYSESF